MRRAHTHVLLRGVPADDVAGVEAVTRKVWSGEQGMGSRLEVRELRTPAGATAYLTLHHHKREQRPPEGLRVTRFRPSRGYFGRPVGELRAEARSVLGEKRVRRAAWALLDGEALDRMPEAMLEDELASALREARAARAAVELVRVLPDGYLVRMRPAA
jgi:hypothetical protein